MSEMVKNFRDLQVWQKARVLVQLVYRLTAHFPDDERYGLISQMRRAAISVMSNIAEGSSKKSTKEFIRFINITCGSLAELQSQSIISQDLGYAAPITALELDNAMAELSRMLHALHTSLQSKLIPPEHSLKLLNS